MAAVRALVEGTSLHFDEVAARTGVGSVTVARWTRRHGWRLGPFRGQPADARAAAPGAALGRRWRYDPADHEAARALIEGSRLSLEQVELRLGISSLTLFRWTRRFGWNRPAKPTRSGPQLHRYRRRGRPYAADAVGIAERLVTGSDMSQAYIARQAGVCQQTISDWIRRRGWVRPPVPRRHKRFRAARREEVLAACGDRQGRGYGERTVAAARELYTQTEFSTALIAARVGAGRATVIRWARRNGWTRPRDLPDAHGRVRRRRRPRAA